MVYATRYECYGSKTSSNLLNELKQILVVTKEDKNQGNKRIEKKLARVTEAVANSIRFRPMNTETESQISVSESELETFNQKMEQSLKFQPSVNL